MSTPQRFAQYIQRLAYQTFVQREEREDPPEDVPSRRLEPTPRYSAWSATSFSGYTPFSSPADK